MSELNTIKLRQMQKRLLIAGVGAITVCVIGAFFSPSQFFHSYLIGYLLLLGTTLGAAGFLMLHHLTGGYWGLILRRILEAVIRTLPLIALFTIPLLFGLHFIYRWADPSAVAADPLLQSKQFYLTIPLFLIRQILYFIIWFTIGFFLLKFSKQQDQSDEPGILQRLRLTSGPGSVLLCLAITFAAVDWIMSIEPHFYSTTFGLRLITGEAVSGLSFAVIAAMALSSVDPISSLLTEKRLRDLGNLMLAFIMLWAYIAFTEYLIVWAGDIPEETSWFVRRFSGGWKTLAWLLILFHFFIPFFLLLQRAVKRRPWLLAAIACWLLVMRWLELLWMVEPSKHASFHLDWMNILAPIGLTGIWLSVFLRGIQKRPLVPRFDPLLKSVHHGR
jgi:hypothetical protein